MTINVPPDVERSILAAVQSGRFRSVEDAVSAAWLEWDRKHKAADLTKADDAVTRPDPLFGLWKDYADEMDEIVAGAYRHRREEKR